MCELRPGLAECLFRESALRHILNRADILQTAIPVSAPVSDQLQVLDGVVGHQQPLLAFEVGDAASRAFDHVIQQRDVFRMDSTTDQLERHAHADVKLEDAIELL